MNKKTKPCPACRNELNLPKEYFDALKYIRKEVEKFREVIIKDHVISTDGMRYIKIPIKDKAEGKRLAEDHLGVLMWRMMDDGSIIAYPYDNENLVILTRPE